MKPDMEVAVTALRTVTTSDVGWDYAALDALDADGAVLVGGVLSDAEVRGLRDACDAALEGARNSIGVERLERAGEMGIGRFPMLFDVRFFDLLELEPVLRLIDETTGEASICHVMNAFVLPSLPAAETKAVFQNSMHMDFPRRLGDYVASVNTFFPLGSFTQETGATRVLLGSHRLPTVPTQEEFEANAVSVECEPGGMLFFNSNTWHAAGRNTSGSPRYAINIQWTRSFFKQQVDYVRALGDERVLAQQPRTQQILGWYTRLPTTLDEYYRDPDARLYRSGQG